MWPFFFPLNKTPTCGLPWLGAQFCTLVQIVYRVLECAKISLTVALFPFLVYVPSSATLLKWAGFWSMEKNRSFLLGKHFFHKNLSLK